MRSLVFVFLVIAVASVLCAPEPSGIIGSPIGLGLGAPIGLGLGAPIGLGLGGVSSIGIGAPLGVGVGVPIGVSKTIVSGPVVGGLGLRGW